MWTASSESFIFDGEGLTSVRSFTGNNLGKATHDVNNVASLAMGTG
jgi:hypothetical protein